MSTAILISGQLRTFAQCYPTQRWHVYRHFPDCHFFITVQDDPAIQFVDTLRRDYGADHVHVDVRKDPEVVKSGVNVVNGGVSLFITPEIEAAYNQAPYANAAPAHQLLLQHWYQAEVWKHFLALSSQLSALSSTVFDTVIRIRPDQFFHSFDQPNPEYAVHLDGPYMPSRVAFTPWWGRFGGVNDRLAILGRDAARAYFTVYEQIPALLAQGCPFHPESLVKAALLEANCTLHETLRTEFTTLRLDGNHRPPEIMPWDLAHAALRAA